jgi:lactoylglutathione lyase
MSIIPTYLAKDALDIGLFTETLEPMLAFWQQEIGLTFDHMLPLGGGVRQHRHDFHGGVFKLNHSRHALPKAAGGGHIRLIIARADVTDITTKIDPDGNAVTLVPPSTHGIHHWAIEIAANSEDEFLAFYHTALGLPLTDSDQIAVQVGRSQIIARIDPMLAVQTNAEPMARAGYRYTTLQVDKVDPVHAAVLAAGGTEGAAPKTLGETARISFIRDTLGNWMELSQRASITGSLDPH